jgi:ectoine hydroxylase-related dioxygenase (phytanoyl-CoA dioxygenase family)
VAARVDAPGWRGWSEKEGSLFVQAPVAVLEQLVAVRLHLDDCSAVDGPLRVLPGSHRLGLLADEEASRLRAQSTEIVCEARQGDALLLRPLLLHASSKANGHSLRRVLHFLFGPPELPQGLRWQHAV